jgi:sigma-B regulation protein RsbU (phosphoserine phosphatase)
MMTRYRHEPVRGRRWIGGVLTEAARPDAGLLAEALDALSDGVMVFAPDWTILHVNRVGADLMGRRPDELTSRNLWIALPELGGTIFHTFLLRAADADHPVTWQGFHPPTGRWLNASASTFADRLHVRFHEVTDRASDGAATATPTGSPVEGTPAERPHGREQERLRFLAEVSEAMISTLDTGESASKLVELVAGRLCDWAIVSVQGENGAPTSHAWAHADPTRLVDMETYLNGRKQGGDDESPLVTALMSGRPVQMSPIDEDAIEASLTTDEVRDAWQRLDTTSCTIAPLRARGETFGALILLNTSQRPPHTEMQIATAMEVARRASLAMDNARLYGRQLRVAETLQQSMLTPPPEPDHLEVAVRYVPAATHMHVGGDWYDGLQQPDGATVLVIGDVVGHNLEAAAAMGQIRSIVRAIAYDRQDSPARILDRVDEVLTGLHIGTLATVLVARIEQTPEQVAAGLHTLRWSSAGHLPPLLLHPQGGVDVLATTPERLLGTDGVHPRSDHEAVIGPEDTLVFYTDGLVEHGRIDLDAGIARLAEALSEVGDLTVDKMCDQMLARIVPDRTDDDIAIIAVRCNVDDSTQ